MGKMQSGITVIMRLLTKIDYIYKANRHIIHLNGWFLNLKDLFLHNHSKLATRRNNFAHR